MSAKRAGIISGVGAALVAFGFILAFNNKIALAQCREIRAGFDLGDTSTRLLVAETDICSKKIIKVLLDRTENISFQNDLSSSMSLSPQTIENGLGILRKLKAEGRALGVKSFRGYATNTFRLAVNGLEIVDFYSQRLDMNLRVVSQKEEELVRTSTQTEVLPDMKVAAGAILE